jgi:hypothetical protein
MKKKLLWAGGVIATLMVVYFLVRENSSISSSDILVGINRGPFKVEIETTGELEAKNSVKILGLSEFGRSLSKRSWMKARS